MTEHAVADHHKAQTRPEPAREGTPENNEPAANRVLWLSLQRSIGNQAVGRLFKAQRAASAEGVTRLGSARQRQIGSQRGARGVEDAPGIRPHADRNAAAMASGLGGLAYAQPQDAFVEVTEVDRSADENHEVETGAHTTCPDCGGAMQGGACQHCHKRGTRAEEPTHAAVQQESDGAALLQRQSVTDLIPDFILNPIKNLVGQVPGFGSGAQTKAESAAGSGQSKADLAATHADSQLNEGATAQKAATSAEAQAGQQQAAVAQQQTAQTAVAGNAAMSGFGAAKGVAEYATDPVKPLVQGPPAVAAAPANGAPPVAKQLAAEAKPPAAAADWDCSESQIVAKVTSAGKSVVDGMTKAVKKIPGGAEVLAWADSKIQSAKQTAAKIQQTLTAMRDAVNTWLEGKLKPIKDTIAKAEKWISDKWDAAKTAISEKAKAVLKWASEAWDTAKTAISGAVKGAIDWAKNGVTSLADKAKDLAGRVWSALPDWIKAPLMGGAAAIAAPIALAYKAGEAAADYIAKKAAVYKPKLQALADQAVQWVADKYKSVKETVKKVADSASKAWDSLKKTASEKWKQAYDAIDKASGGQLSKWRAAAAKEAAELKGEACAIAGETVGPCIDKFVPDPAAGGGAGFATFALKGNLTVPIEGVPVTVAAGAGITIKRTDKTYTATISGDASVGVGMEKAGDKGETSGEVSVEGTSLTKPAAMLHLGAGGGPAAPIALGGDKKPTAAGGQPAGGQPAGQQAPKAGDPAAADPKDAGGGGGKVKASVGKKLSASLTYTFDASADKTTCDGLGGLSAFVASQGGAALLPAPFNNLVAGAGQAAFADKLTSASVTMAETGEVALEFKGGGAKGKLGATGEQGVTVASSKDATTGDQVLSATLYQQVTGEASGELAPEGVKLFKGAVGLSGQAQCQITYNRTKDKTDAGLSQTLGASLSLGTFPGFLNALPAGVQEAIKSRMAGVPNASDGKIAVSLTSKMDHLADLASRLDAVLSTGDSATAVQVWEAVKAYMVNPQNVNIQLKVTLTLTEKVLGVKASAGDGETSGGGELSITRGKEITLYDQPYIK